jgi:hypothetical protein
MVRMKSLPRILLFVFVFFAGSFHVMGQPHPVYFVINNQTSFHNDDIFLSIQGSSNLSAWNGTDNSLAGNNSYSLSSLLGNLPGGTLTNVPILYSTRMDGGFFNITVGQQVDGNPAPSNIISGRFEANVQTGDSSAGAQAFFNTNVDISYVNSISMPMSFSILQRSNNQPLPLVNQLSTVSTQSPQIWTAINASPAIPAAAKVDAVANYEVKSTSGLMGTVTGPVTTLASGSSSAYHDWLTNDTVNNKTSLLNTLQGANAGAGTVLNVSSFTSPAGDTFGNNLFGFSGAPTGTSPFGSNDPTNRFLAAQSYTTTAHFTSNLNPGGSNTNLAGFGIIDGTAGVMFSGFGADGTGAGNTVGAFNIYITNVNLNDPVGIYGSNPFYVVEWTSFDGSTQNGTTLYVQQQNSNNLIDRVVGDLTAGITFGWAASDILISDHAAATSTESLLDGTIFSSSYTGSGTSVADQQISQISPGQYFYLLSVLGIEGEATSESGANIALWSGSQINPNNYLLYDNYGDVLVSFTDAYSYPYSDRLQGYSPDVFPLPATGAPSDADNMYIYLTLNDGGYTYTIVPEPSSLALTFLALAAFCTRLCLRKRVS